MLKSAQIGENSMKKNIVLSLVIAAFVMSGCSSKVPEIDSGMVDSGLNSVNDGLQGTGVDDNIDRMSGMDSSSVSYGSEDERVSAIENELQPVYFGTDRYDISVTESEKVDLDANVLNGSVASDLNVNVEGNCDEWGTDEYNYALGLKRAKAMKDGLIAAGVDSARLSIISFGESKPLCESHNAECWQQNRRADVKVILP
jgi:peptidoglycan-associated lipoprotein